ELLAPGMTAGEFGREGWPGVRCYTDGQNARRPRPGDGPPEPGAAAEEDRTRWPFPFRPAVRRPL
ncbi:MAG: hypothetical protein ACR2J8_04270, partial [Thermomicrobiales bacterium]